MQYQVIVPSRVQKDLARIGSRFQTRITAALVVLARDPYVGKKLKGDREGDWSYRVWPYRILYRIKKERLIVLVVRIGHRQGIY